MPSITIKEFDKFVYFTRLQLETGDYDAHIPFLRGLVDHLNLNKEKSLWLGFLYMAYYTEGSMYAAFIQPGVASKKTFPPVDLPITTQRRNLYGGRIHRHFEDLLSRGSLVGWVGQCETWQELIDEVGSVYGNGRWARYTTSELINVMADLKIVPDTFEITESSGPRKGLIALELEPIEQSAEYLIKRLSKEGVNLSPSMLESILCDWAGMNKGTFYAGRNIDRQLGRILQVEVMLNTKFPVLWEVRDKVFPKESLGEHYGWKGMDNPRKKLYMTKGIIPKPGEQR